MHLCLSGESIPEISAGSNIETKPVVTHTIVQYFSVFDLQDYFTRDRVRQRPVKFFDATQQIKLYHECERHNILNSIAWTWYFILVSSQNGLDFLFTIFDATRYPNKEMSTIETEYHFHKCVKTRKTE